MKNPIPTGRHPKIGIRPIIDGRRGGIRESLEAMTMGMAERVARLYGEELRYADGAPVECVIADTTIGGVAEAAAAAEKFRDNNVGAVVSVTPCWCYGAETIDMDPLMPKAIWGFNGTERPGAVYLASALAGHNQKGLPAFGIYGRDVQDVTDETIPTDVREKLLRFGRAAVAVMQMRGKSYLSIGSVSMGIAGSMPDPDFFQEYLGMRSEAVDCSEIERRVELGIYDKEEFARAMAWVEKYCKPREGADCNPEHLVYSREKKDEVWEYAVKMTQIFRDLMHGNPKLAEMGFEEEAMGHNAIAGGFQGQRQWTDFRPDGDFAEAVLNSSFDWNGIREAITFATENDTLNGASMLLLHLLTNRAQIFADVRTFWSPEACKRASGYAGSGQARDGPQSDGQGRGRHHPPDKLGLVHAGCDGAPDGCGGQPGDETVLGNRGTGGRSVSRSDDVVPCGPRIHARRRILVAFPDARRNADDDVPAESCERPGPRIADSRRLGGERGRRDIRHRQPPDRPHVADDVVRPSPDGQHGVPRRLRGDEQLGRQPRSHQLRPCRRRPDNAGFDAAHTGVDAQRSAGRTVPPYGLGRVRLRTRRRRLPRLPELRTSVSLKNRNLK